MGNAETSNGKSNDELVDNLVKNEVVKKKEIELVMRLVDRGNFVPEGQRRAAYRDSAWKSDTANPGFLHLSAPCVYASVLENLKLEKGMSFLNIGSGTGYLSTMVGFLLGERGVNHGLELYDNVLFHSINCVQKTLMSAEVSAFEWCEPEFKNGNAFQIKTEMRYDRIYCGALVPHSRRSYFCNFLKIGGIFVVPYGHLLQRIVRQSDTQFVVYDVSSVVFSQLVQPNQENEEMSKRTVRPLNIPLLQSRSLMDICRNKIRQCVRESVEEVCPLQMRYQSLKTRGQRSEESGSTSSELTPFRQPPVRRNRFPLWIVGRNNLLLFDGEVPINEVDGQAEPRENRNQRREPNANPRQFFAMIGERIARHQRARNARNAEAEQNPVIEDLIDEQDEELRADVNPVINITPGEPQFLDDRDFELNMGFRFKRGRTEDENGEENFGNIRFGPRHRIILAEEEIIDQNLELDLGHENTQNIVLNRRGDPGNHEGGEVVPAIIIDDEELEDGIGHALDDPLADVVDVLNESFGVESNESLENERQIGPDVDLRSESSVSDDEDSGSDEEVSEEGADIPEDELQGQNPDDDELDADQTEGARLQALHLATFHEEFSNRLELLPLSSAMRAFLKTREAAFINQSPDGTNSYVDDLEEKLYKNQEVAK